MLIIEQILESAETHSWNRRGLSRCGRLLDLPLQSLAPPSSFTARFQQVLPAPAIAHSNSLTLYNPLLSHWLAHCDIV
jgi:hypothetical protein